MRVTLAPVSTVVLLALASASVVLGVVDRQLSPPCRFVLGSRKIASAASFFFGISKLCGTGKSIPEPIDSSSKQALTTSPSSSSPSVHTGSDLDNLRLASCMYVGNDDQPKSSFEAYLISKANRPTSFDSSASSSSFRFTTAAATEANVDSKIADGPEESALDEFGLGPRVSGNKHLVVVYDGMGSLDSKKEDSQVRFVGFAVCTNVHACVAMSFMHCFMMQMHAHCRHFLFMRVHMVPKSPSLPLHVSLLHCVRVLYVLQLLTVYMLEISTVRPDLRHCWMPSSCVCCPSLRSAACQDCVPCWASRPHPIQG